MPDDEPIETFMDVWGQSVLLWQRLRRPILASEKVTQADKRILYGLHRVKEVAKKELAQRVVLEHSSLTRSLERLEKKGLIKRDVSQDDKRFIKLSLTQAGLKKVRVIKMRSLKLLKTLLSDTLTKDLKQTNKVIKQFKAAMEMIVEKI